VALPPIDDGARRDPQVRSAAEDRPTEGSRCLRLPKVGGEQWNLPGSAPTQRGEVHRVETARTREVGDAACLLDQRRVDLDH